MSLNELHDIRNFAELFADRRFKSAIVHLRENHPATEDKSADHWRGWFGALKALERLAEAPKQKSDPMLHVPYSGAPAQNQP